tara:strand:+ start:397 stop:666 length:270 start_codon:yes stop_codon:yes gene_type:complete
MDDVKWYGEHLAYFDERDDNPKKNEGLYTRFFSYLVITETLDDRNLHILNDDYDEAVEFKNKAEKDDKYTYIGEVRKINYKTYLIIMGC